MEIFQWWQLGIYGSSREVLKTLNHLSYVRLFTVLFYCSEYAISGKDLLIYTGVSGQFQFKEYGKSDKKDIFLIDPTGTPPKLPVPR